MMNSELVLRSALGLAAQLLDRRDLDDADRIRRLYVRAYGRPPSPAELRRAEAFLGRFESALQDGEARRIRRHGAWQALCQAMLASNEFVTIR